MQQSCQRFGGEMKEEKSKNEQKPLDPKKFKKHIDDLCKANPDMTRVELLIPLWDTPPPKDFNWPF